MLIQGSAKSKRTNLLIQKYAELLNSGVEASEVLVLTLNSFKKNFFINETKELLTVGYYENPQIHTFYGLAYNTVTDNWAQIEQTLNTGKPIITPNLSGLEISQFFLRQAVKEVGFQDYNSKINLIQQLFRRNSLIVNNNLSDYEVKKRAKLLGEVFSDDAKTALDIFKKKTIEYRAFDYIRQVNIFNFVYQNTDYFKNIKYLILDDADEITTAEFDFIKYLKPQLKQVFIGYDKFGSSRLGFLNADIKTVEKLEDLFRDEEIIIEDNIERYINKAVLESTARRLEMLEKGIERAIRLVESGIKPDDILIVTPTIDSALKFSVSEAFEPKDIKYQYFSGNEKLIDTPAVKNTITLLNLSLDSPKNVFNIRSVLSQMLKIPVRYCIQVIDCYKKNERLDAFDLKVGIYNEKLRLLLEVLTEIKGNELSLSEKIFIIYKKLITIEGKEIEQLETFNFFMKQIQDFESVFAEHKMNPKMQKAILTQLENSIISENPSSAPERNENSILISTAQKVVDFSIKTKYQIWLDTSSNEWTKEDLGTLYNAWVFQSSWDKDKFTYEDNLEFSKIKTEKMLRKLSILAEEKIFAYSSLFDIQGNENFGGIEPYLILKKEDNKIDFNFIPRSDQKPVLEYKRGKMAISAVPGAGKTTILLALIIKLIKNKVPPENIFVMTYMDSAARNFKERIKTACPSLDKLPSISTIHGLALRILKENSNFVRAGLDENFEVCDDNQRQKIIRELLSKMEFEQDDFDKFEKAISALKLSGSEKIPYTSDNELKKFLKFYYSYNFYLKDRNIIDYDDMLAFCVKILEENKDIAEYYQDLCEYVIEDEAQDSSVIQQRLLEILSAKHKNLIRCGDINQAITTTFTNADTEGFRSFIKENDNITMNLSQRCAEGIYTLANKLIEHSKQIDDFKNAFFDVKMDKVEGKNPHSPNASEIKYFENYKDEQAFILEKIRNVFSIEKNPSIAILVRSNYQIEEYLDFLSNFGYSVITRSDCLKEQPIFAVIYSVMKFSQHPWQNEGIIEIAKILQSQRLVKIPQSDFDYLKELKTPFIMEQQDNIESEVLSQLWWDLNYWLECSSLPLDEFAIKIGNYYYCSEIEKSNIYMISLLFKKLSNQYNDYSVLMERLSELAKKPVMNQFKFFADDKKQSNDGEIQLMTYHKSKGDEFDFVFIPQLSEEILPLKAEKIKIKSKERFIEAVKALNSSYKKKDEQKLKIFQIEENLRLLYVAVTRAKKKLYISTAGKYKKFSKIRESLPSTLFETVLKTGSPGEKNG